MLSSRRSRPAVPGLPVAPAPSPAPLPLPSPGWTLHDARAAVRAALPLLPVGLLPVRLDVVSALTTVVLRCGDWALKVYPPGTDPTHLARIATALAPLGDLVQLPSGAPVSTSHGVVTATPWLRSAGAVPWPRLGALLAAFHDRTDRVAVPAWTPLSRLPSQVTGLRPEDAGVLLRARTELLSALTEVVSDLGVGVIHGDVSPGNALRSPGTPARLIDTDWVAVGPREYDLAAAARRARSGELDPHTYREFCSAYGADVSAWPGLPVLDRLAELGALAFRLWDDRHHRRALDWVAGEVPRWRTPI